MAIVMEAYINFIFEKTSGSAVNIYPITSGSVFSLDYCPRCNGRGFISCNEITPQGIISDVVPCPVCKKYEDYH